MSLTVIANAMDALYDVLAADTTLAAEVTAGRLRIWDGPAVGDFAEASMLTVGAQPIVDADNATSVDWDWATLGVDGTHAEVDEAYDIPCGISTASGGTNMRSARRTAFTLYEAAAAVIRGTTLAIPQVMWGIPQVTSIRYIQGESGADCLVLFTAHFRTRI